MVAYFGVISHVLATTPAHNAFCYSAVAHILTPSVKFAFRLKSGFKNKCRGRAGFGPGFKMRPFSNSVWVCRQGPARGGWKDTSSAPPTNNKNVLKSFCEVGYANFRPNAFSAGKRTSIKILVEVGLHAWCPVAFKRFVAFLKNGNVPEKYLSSL